MGFGPPAKIMGVTPSTRFGNDNTTYVTSLHETSVPTIPWSFAIDNTPPDKGGFKIPQKHSLVFSISPGVYTQRSLFNLVDLTDLAQFISKPVERDVGTFAFRTDEEFKSMFISGTDSPALLAFRGSMSSSEEVLHTRKGGSIANVVITGASVSFD